jgi:hypothetical protein
MPVITRSTAIRRRNLVRKLTFVIRDRMLEDETDTESEYDSDTEYYPSDSDTETETETETDSDDETATVVSDEGEYIRERVERLRNDLRLAEEMLKKWQAEQDAQLRENNRTCIPLILALAIILGVYNWLDWNVRHKQMKWL